MSLDIHATIARDVIQAQGQRLMPLRSYQAFLQMAGYVLLTVWLRQKGSSESKEVEGEEAVDADPRLNRDKPNVPWPVRVAASR